MWRPFFRMVVIGKLFHVKNRHLILCNKFQYFVGAETNYKLQSKRFGHINDRSKLQMSTLCGHDLSIKRQVRIDRRLEIGRGICLHQIRCCDCSRTQGVASSKERKISRFRPSKDYYDANLFGLDSELDERVRLHKLDTMVYDQAEGMNQNDKHKEHPNGKSTLPEQQTDPSRADQNDSQQTINVNNDTTTAKSQTVQDHNKPGENGKQDNRQNDPINNQQAQDEHHRHHHHHHHHHKAGHKKVFIKPDPSERIVAKVQSPMQTMGLQAKRESTLGLKAPPAQAGLSARHKKTTQDKGSQQLTTDEQIPSVLNLTSEPKVITVVDEDQLHERFINSLSSRRLSDQSTSDKRDHDHRKHRKGKKHNIRLSYQDNNDNTNVEHSVSTSDAGLQGSQFFGSSEYSSKSGTHSSSNHRDSFKHAPSSKGKNSPPADTIIIPAKVINSLKSRKRLSGNSESFPKSISVDKTANSESKTNTASSISSFSRTRKPNVISGLPPTSGISLEQLEYGTLLKSTEVQLLYTSPEADLDRELKDEQAKQVAPGTKQSPVALMTLNPSYRRLYKPLNVDYHGIVENLRMNNTGFFWDVKIPYQISMMTSLHGAQYSSNIRYRLDQFHCHWGENDSRGSEHTVDSRYYSAELHFLHYNMEKYRTLAQAARHPDGLVVVAVFLQVGNDNHNHPELEKIASNLSSIPLRGEHTIIKQGIRIENLLPQNRSFWSYQGSLTTSPFYESVTWFVMKHPIQCSSSQLTRFRSMKSSVRRDEDSPILRNFRDIQPLNGRVVFNYDDHSRTHDEPR